MARIDGLQAWYSGGAGVGQAQIMESEIENMGFVSDAWQHRRRYAGAFGRYRRPRIADSRSPA